MSHIHLESLYLCTGVVQRLGRKVLPSKHYTLCPNVGGDPDAVIKAACVESR